MKNSRFWNMAITISFVFIVAAGFLLFIFTPAKEFSVNEKRYLAKMPEISLESLAEGELTTGLDTYVVDHFPLRDQLVGIYSRFQRLTGDYAANGVYLVDGNRLISVAENYDPADISGKVKYINNFASDIEIPVDMMLIPSAGYSLEEKLPKVHAEVRDEEVFEQVKSELDESVNYVDLSGELAGKAESPDYYYLTDHHLTSLGAYRVCKLYAGYLGLDMPDEDEYEVSSYSGFYGSLYNKAGLWDLNPDSIEIWINEETNPEVEIDGQKSDSMYFMNHLEEPDKYPVFLDGNHGLVVIEGGNPDGPSILMLRDSFGHCIGTFAADCFSRIVMADLRYYKKPVSDLVKEYDVDRALIVYGMDNFMTDTNFAWLK